MPIELKDIAEFTGLVITDETTLDDVKSKFNELYVPVKKHSDTLGELNGKVSHAIHKAAKELGLEIPKEAFKDKNIYELPSVLGEFAKTRMEELESAKGATAEEIEAKYKSDLEKYKGKVTEKESLLADVQGQFETFKTQVETDRRKSKVESEYGKVFGGLKFAETVKDLEKAGFEAMLKNNYQFDLDDEGLPVVKDKDGKAVTSTAKAGTLATFEEVITSEFKKLGLDSKVDPKKVSTFGGRSTVEAPNGRDLNTNKSGFSIAR